MKLLLLGLAACSSNVDLSGVYSVTADVSSSPCGSDVPVMMPPGYLKFYESDVDGIKIVNQVPCEDPAGSVCSTLGDSYGEPIDNGWRSIETSETFASSCGLGYSVQTAVLHGLGLVIEAKRYYDMPMLDQAHCTTEEAEKRNTTMPCEMHERIEATKL